MEQTTECDQIGELNIEDFKLWSMIALKNFLSLRKKSTSGSFDTLVARCFAAYEEKIEVDHEAEHRHRVVLKDYLSKLSISDGQDLPDPFKFTSGWLDEANGMKMWPILCITDISRFYDVTLARKNLIYRLECDYKEGKAYRYFTTGFIHEVLYHVISDSCKYCIIKTQCLPAQRVSAKPYDLWAIIEKGTDDNPGGEIKSAYCTCTAGLLGSCNHVAGMLFRVEAAIITGVAHPTCTSELARWNVPSTMKKVVPKKIEDCVYASANYSKKAVDLTLEEKKASVKKQLAFSVMSNSQEAKLKDEEFVREKLFSTLKGSVPNSCFVELMNKKKERADVLTINSLLKMGELFQKNLHATQNKVTFDMLNDFKSYIALSPENLKYIYEKTSGQSTSDLWKEQRIGRITASIFKDVYHKANKLMSVEGKEVDTVSILEQIMKYTEFHGTWAMKYGIATEIHAKAKLKKVLRKSHKNCSFQDPGLFISSLNQFIGASPDLVVTCNCHGTWLVEIKCPSSLIGKVPDVNNYSDHLKEENNSVYLKRNSPYFFQIQGQMGVTGIYDASLFVFSFCGYLLIPVYYDQEFWINLQKNICFFWEKVVAEELIFQTLKTKLIKFSAMEVCSIPKIDFKITSEEFETDSHRFSVNDIVDQNYLSIEMN